VAVTYLSVTLLARNRQSEITDAEWLEEFEKELEPNLRQHGHAWLERRDRYRPHGIARVIPLVNAFGTWAVGLVVFGIAALGVLVVTAVAPEWFQS